MWQDMSPDTNSFNIFAKNKKFIKLNIYKLFDFSTLAQWEIQK